MTCESCGADDFERPAVPSAMEIWRCRNCGLDVAVHCHYIPDLSGFRAPVYFAATASFDTKVEALKALFKLKRSLAFAQHLRVSHLEEQQRAGQLTWLLGDFYDFEVERVTEACAQAGVRVSFEPSRL